MHESIDRNVTISPLGPPPYTHTCFRSRFLSLDKLLITSIDPCQTGIKLNIHRLRHSLLIPLLDSD